MKYVETEVRFVKEKGAKTKRFNAILIHRNTGALTRENLDFAVDAVDDLEAALEDLAFVLGDTRYSPSARITREMRR